MGKFSIRPPPIGQKKTCIQHQKFIQNPNTRPIFQFAVDWAWFRVRPYVGIVKKR